MKAEQKWYAKEGQVIDEPTGKTIAIIPNYLPADSEQNRDARLIAAAPEMLKILLYLRDNSGPNFDRKTWREIADAVARAIH